MPKIKTLILCPPDAYFLPIFDQLRDEAELLIGSELSFLSNHIADAEVIVNSGLTHKGTHLRELWPEAKSVRWVHSLSAGVENLLFPALIESSVPVTNAKGVFKRPLAEFAILGVLYFYKQVRRLVESQRSVEWDQFLVQSLPGRTMGIVGYGEIGRECALLAKALGMRIVATRRRPELGKDDPLVDESFAMGDLNAMLAVCDVVVMSAPATPETFHMMGEAQFHAMKKTAVLINLGRGSTVDESALARALVEDRIAGAALDVFETEPLPKESPLWGLKNVLLSPHCTDRTVNPDWLEMAALRFVENFGRYRKGEPLEWVVDKKAGY